MPAVALIGTLDTKGDEIAYVRERLPALRVGVVVIDSGILGEPAIAADITREEVARAGGHALADVRAAGSRGAAVALMREGVREVVVRQFAEGRVHGVLCLGGAEGALLGAAAMQALPVGVPKLLVSPCASAGAAGSATSSARATSASCTRWSTSSASTASRGRSSTTPPPRWPGMVNDAGSALGHARRALRRDHDARPDDAGRDAPARARSCAPATSP